MVIGQDPGRSDEFHEKLDEFLEKLDAFLEKLNECLEILDEFHSAVSGFWRYWTSFSRN